MGYTNVDFVAFEVLTAAKMNLMGDNDASFNDGTGFADDIIQSKHIDWSDTGGGDNGGIWWEELGRHTLSSTADVMSVTGMGARKYLRIYIVGIPSGGTANANMTFNNDSGNSYARRSSSNGAADSTSGSIGFIAGTASAVDYHFWSFADIVNIAAQEKLVILQGTSRSTAGAGNAPNRMELVGKWANTANQITRVDVNNTGTGDFAAGSEIVVLGHN